MGVDYYSAFFLSFLFLFLVMIGCGGNSGGGQDGSDTTSPTASPTITSTSPVRNANEVNVSTVITVTFSEAMDASTINTSTFTLKDSDNDPVTGTVTYDGTTAMFTPSWSLKGSTTYTATITNGVKDLSGDAVTSDYQWSFTTGSSPYVTSTSPANGAVNVAISTTITATFSEAMNSSTINTTTFTVKDHNNKSVSGTVTYSGTTATFTPLSSLANYTTYTATISTGAKDFVGDPLFNSYSWSFTTIPASDLFYSYEAFPTGSYPEAVAIGDVNGDGRNDVVMTTSWYDDPDNDYKVFVFLQNTSGQLASPVKYSTGETYLTPETVDIGDVNNDGRNDVVVGNSGSMGDVGSIEVFLQDSSGGLNSGISYSTVNSYKIRIADLNNDGLLDVVGVGWGTNSVDVFLQNKSGTLNSPITYSVTHGGWEDLEVGDVNNDRLTDIIVTSIYDNTIGVLIQKNGTFNTAVYYEITEDSTLQGIGVGDVNGDNLEDIVVTYGEKIGIFPQNTSGTLDSLINYSSYENPEPVEVADVTSDGKKDIIVAHGGWYSLGVYRQRDGGDLLPEELYTIPYASNYNSHGLAVGDINGDGKNDVVIADYNSGLVVLYHR